MRALSDRFENFTRALLSKETIRRAHFEAGNPQGHGYFGPAYALLLDVWNCRMIRVARRSTVVMAMLLAALSGRLTCGRGVWRRSVGSWGLNGLGLYTHPFFFIAPVEQGFGFGPTAFVEMPI